MKTPDIHQRQRQPVPIERARVHLGGWLRTASGRVLLAEETSRIDAALSNLFGYHIVQVGNMDGVDLLRSSRILGRSLVDVDGTARGTHPYPTVRATPTSLPIDTHALDVAVLPHVLDFELDPHEALREAFRILRPEGHLVLCGFNPWSAMGLWRFARRHRRRAPWSGQFLTLVRMRDWLALLGFEVLDAHGCFFRPPVSSARVLQRLEFLEHSARRFAGALCGSYVLVARKRVMTMTPIRPRWSDRRHLVGVGLAEPSTRVSGRD